MSEMIERVARIVSVGDAYEYSWEFMPPHEQDRLRKLAAGVIAAMREPTEAMVDTGEAAGNPVYEPRVIWSAMIDEALK